MKTSYSEACAVADSLTVETGDPRKIHIALDRRGLVANNNLHAFRQAVKRNTPPDCEKTDDENLRAIMNLAAKNLRTTHVYIANLADGTQLAFTGEVLPAYCTPRSALRSVGFIA